MQPNLDPTYLASQGLNKTFFARFWAKVNTAPHEKGCWLWTGGLAKGYGQIRPNNTKQPCIKAHRASWILFNGPIPENLWVLHHCDNPICVNPSPDHLFVGTPKDNSEDRDEKGRGHPVCTYGIERWNHKLTPESAKIIRDEYAQGQVSQRTLARRFNVCHSTIVCCLKGKTWM